ncbi:hypothetical protein BU24DRAFT_166291 [Aaosphaeria arxii CBS 175.79]|uniref:Only prolin and serin are matching in the corresponding protein n=1 Tax=Aaosphaeria arxii CBS 175.79 TaxID=1450172 RepID=A0A6A5XYV4_9PLEO|nr:uncharacterized protein BU24DRAFT_166291 [Aaosphaeria arxii CBS 175.79]KAF2018166.1 hypothetical protein BU24DRAFT_166291 [Aaosphaeria arxii CBS 175.79]
MRDIKPLMLPQLVAARKSSKSSLDMAYDPHSSVHSSGDSGFYSVSDCSTPPTPSYPSRGHLRYPSSTSSLSSSPPTHDSSMDGPNSSGKLPKLTEEPIEREDDYVTVDPYRCSCDGAHCFHSRPPTRRSIFGQAYDFAEDYFSNDSEPNLSKRRRSLESPTLSISDKFENKFPTITRKIKERKRASTLGAKSSRSATPSRAASIRAASTRSPSITSSIHQYQGIDMTQSMPIPTPARSRDRLDETFATSPIDVAKANAIAFDPEEIEAERYATTPLLPPMLITGRLNDLPTQSPLQSPTVAADASTAATPADSPPLHANPTPPLSTKPSVSSFKARAAHMVPAADIPPFMLADPNDKWTDILGHANFTIEPEPYLPETFDKASLRQLFSDWEQARHNFTKHQVRTAEHHGVTSKTYLLTDQKWAEIDALWKANNDLAISRATALGEEPEPTSPMEPAPLSKMPSLNDPKGEGKFPKLGDEDIVGPMVQIAAQIQKTPPRKRAFFKFFSDLKFPASFLSRSSAGVRSR